MKLALLFRCFVLKQESEALSKHAKTGFSGWVGVTYRYEGLAWAVEVLGCLLEHPVALDPSGLERLSRKAPEQWLTTCFLETVASVENPFVAGTTLSVALSKAADDAPQGERRKLSSLQNKLDALLLEVLERLPQTVQGFEGAMAGCSAIFEPEVSSADSRGLLGPLAMVLQDRGHMETFCTQPLVVDFLTRRFTHGLPDLLDTKRILSDRNEVGILASGSASFRECYGLSESQHQKEDQRRLDRSLIVHLQDKLEIKSFMGRNAILGTLLSPCSALQGVHFFRYAQTAQVGGSFSVPTALTFLPGLQFLTAGLVAKPDAYYRVPAMRMGLDFAVYLGMLILFSAVILSHDDGPLTAGEIVFAFYLLV